MSDITEHARRAREAARGLYVAGSNDDIEIDDDAKVSTVNRTETGGSWVQAWVWVPDTELVD